MSDSQTNNNSKLLVFVSGNGTNLQTIIDCCQLSILPYTVSHVLSNREDAYANQRAKDMGIPSSVLVFNKDTETREQYDQRLLEFTQAIDYDVIVCAGWMHILGQHFLKNVYGHVINLHPALPGQFTGKNAIEQAWSAYQRGEVQKTGIMVHHVVEKVDSGAVIEVKELPIYSVDTLDTLRNRVHHFEKNVLVSALLKLFSNNVAKTLAQVDSLKKYPLVYTGKVRDVHDVGFNVLAMVHSNRQSAFDRHICSIPRKGSVLTATSAWWFNKTRHIVPNHYLHSYENVMIVQKCEPFKVEVVVRGYITGSTKTSLWTHYNKGVRTYCGITFPEGLYKNKKLSENVLTPTTKGDVDIPMSPEELVNNGYIKQEEWDYIGEKALELFAYGQEVALERGFLLVDTKYEFGRTMDGKIVLIDEIHTCDSSRYWIEESYEFLMSTAQEPVKLDKDIIRDYIRARCDPYTEPLPKIPHELVDRVQGVYMDFYRSLTGNTISRIRDSTFNLENYVTSYLEDILPCLAVLIAGSESDRPHINKLEKTLSRFNVFFRTYVASAHKTTEKVMKLLNHYNNSGRKVVYITIAGRSNALSGVVAGNTSYPVIACPPFKDKMDMLVNIQSTLQCPSKIPVMTVLDPSNTAQAVRNMFSMSRL